MWFNPPLNRKQWLLMEWFGFGLLWLRSEDDATVFSLGVLDWWWGTSPDIGSLRNGAGPDPFARFGHYPGVTQRWLTGHVFLHAGFRGFAQAHDRPIWVVLDSACWARKKNFHNISQYLVVTNLFLFNFFLNNHFLCILCFLFHFYFFFI